MACSACIWFIGICRITARRRPHPLDFVGLVLFGSGIALLSYVLEVFGEHTLERARNSGLLAISLLLLDGIWLARGACTQFPLLRMTLLRIRTFRAAVVGGFVTRIGIGGIPFLFPLLYQVGLGFTPIQSGLIMMPQAAGGDEPEAGGDAAFSPALAIVSFLISNTIILGLLIMAICHHWRKHAGLADRGAMFRLRFFASLQYSSMNTLVYADVTEEEASSASTIASTLATDVDQFRRGVGLAGGGDIYP